MVRLIMAWISDSTIKLNKAKYKIKIVENYQKQLQLDNLDVSNCNKSGKVIVA